MLYDSVDDFKNIFIKNKDIYESQNFRGSNTHRISTNIDILKDKLDLSELTNILKGLEKENGKITGSYYYNGKLDYFDYVHFSNNHDDISEWIKGYFIDVISADLADVLSFVFENNKCYTITYNHLELDIATEVSIINDKWLYFIHNELRIYWATYAFG